VHPQALRLLTELDYKTDQLRSKGWEEFSAPGAPPLDFVFTVCDNAAGEVCPVWPGQPMTAHWGIEDPAAVDGPMQERAFIAAYHALQRRIRIFLCLPLDSIDELSLQKSLDEIGVVTDAVSRVE
jgi:protein-tyrosine-phosphatase